MVALSQIIATESMRLEWNSNHYTDSTIQTINIPLLHPEVIVNHFSSNQILQKSWLNRKLFSDNLIHLTDSENVQVSINPVFDFRIGKNKHENINCNTRGFILNGQLTQNLFVRSEFYETQAVLPSFFSQWTDTLKYIPGMIRHKPFDQNGVDYGVVFSQLIWKPFNNYGVRLGYDRIHIGSGYRSIMLSDAAQAYPFLMQTFRYHSWTLSHAIASLRNPDFNNRIGIPRAESGAYQQKWFSFTYLTCSPNPKLNLALYETAVFLPSNSGESQFFPMALLPLPVVRNTLLELKGRHHVLTGFTADYAATDNFSVYAQTLIDALNKQQHFFEGSAQLGVVFKSNHEKPYVLFSEVNLATHNALTSSSALTAYTHNDQSLAHPAGQSFVEWVSGIHMQRQRWIFNATFSMLMAKGLPVTDAFFTVDNTAAGSGFFSPQSSPDKTTHVQVQLAYLINPASNLSVFAGLHFRQLNSSFLSESQSSTLVELGLKHSVRNLYNDFF